MCDATYQEGTGLMPVAGRKRLTDRCNLLTRVDRMQRTKTNGKVIGIGRNVEHAGHEIDPCGVLRDHGGLVADRHDHDCEGEKDQPLEMVVHGALQAARDHRK